MPEAAPSAARMSAGGRGDAKAGPTKPAGWWCRAGRGGALCVGLVVGPSTAQRNELDVVCRQATDHVQFPPSEHMHFLKHGLGGGCRHGVLPRANGATLYSIALSQIVRALRPPGIMHAYGTPTDEGRGRVVTRHTPDTSRLLGRAAGRTGSAAAGFAAAWRGGADSACCAAGLALLAFAGRSTGASSSLPKDKAWSSLSAHHHNRMRKRRSAVEPEG